MVEQDRPSPADEPARPGEGGESDKAGESREDMANSLRDRLNRDLAVQGADSTPAPNEDSTHDGNADRRPDPAGPSND